MVLRRKIGTGRPGRVDQPAAGRFGDGVHLLVLGHKRQVGAVRLVLELSATHHLHDQKEETALKDAVR